MIFECFCFMYSGIYLPLLWEGQGQVFPCDSHPHLRNPLVLGYDCKHMPFIHVLLSNTYMYMYIVCLIFISTFILDTRNQFVPLVTFKGSKVIIVIIF